MEKAYSEVLLGFSLYYPTTNIKLSWAEKFPHEIQNDIKQ